MKLFDVPVLPDAVAVILSVPATVSVTDRDAKTPETNESDVVGEIPVSELDRAAVETKDVTVLPNASFATILMLKAVPAVCVAMFPSAVLVTTK